MILAALFAGQAIVASLTLGMDDGSEATMQVVADSRGGYSLEVNCVRRCAKAMHQLVPIGDIPMGLLSLETDNLVYSLWGTGCCYMVRVWSVTPAGATKVFETGSRAIPSLITNPELAVVTYMRPTDASGRETSLSAEPVRWTYRHGRFEHF